MAKTNTQTADDLRRVANFLSGLIDAADALESIGSLENAKAEAIAAKDKAYADRDTLLAEQRKAEDKLAATKAQADAILLDAQAKADDLVRHAMVQAESIVAGGKVTAQDAAQQILAEAKTRSETLAAQIDSLTEKRDAILSEAAAAQTNLDDLTAKAKDAEARLAKVQAQIAKLLGAQE